MEKSRHGAFVYAQKVLKRSLFLFLLINLLSISPDISASTTLLEQKYTLNLSFKNARLEQVLDAIMKQSGVKIAYSCDELQNNQLVSVDVKTTDILVALRFVLGDGYSFKQIEDYIAIAKEVTSGRPDVISSLAADDRNWTIQGQVMENSEPPYTLAGVNIVIKGTAAGTVSDANGYFNIKAKRGDVLVFRYIGFKDYEYVVSRAISNLTVSLSAESELLDEVVVTGISEEKKLNSISSISSLDVSKNMASKPITSLSQSLQGGITGLNVTQGSGLPGADAATIKIRGISSLETNNDPLVLVDGIPMDMNQLDPNTIESVTVLKDAAAAAIYGARAANGVIVVKTKRGMPGKVNVSYNGYFGLQQATYLPEFIDKIFADISSITIFASKKNNKIMKGAIYSRVSTEQQDYSKQTNELKDYAKRNGIEVVYVFEEKESGFNNNRPEFEKLRKLTKQDIDIILVWEISRISRRAIYLQQQVQEFTDKGICIYAKKDGFSTLNDDGSVNASTKMLIGFASIIAEQEAATLKERTISSKRNKILREGKSYTYYAPYGYDYSKETKMLSINEKQAQVVKRIFQLSIDGYSTERIAILLNAEKIPTKGRKENWTAGTVCNMLTNPVYKGEANYTLKKEKKAGSTYCKPMEVVTISTPAIIEKEQFTLSLQKLAERTKRSNSFGTKYNPLLRGLIHCPYCDVKYVYNFRTNQYLCVNKYKKASNKNVHCTAKCISNKLDSIVWNVVKTFFYKELAAGKAQEQIEPLQAEIESYKRQILLLDGKQSELTARANIIVDAAIEIKIQFPNMPDLYANKMKEVEEINKEASKYQKEKERLEKLIHSNESRIKNINRASKESALVESITDETEKYDLVHKAIDKIMIFGEGKTSIIIVTFSTGQTIYLGYSSKSNSKYYTIFYPSSDIYFDIQTSKGYINHLKEKATINSDGSIYLGDLTGEVKEYSIIDFVNYLDIEENRRYY